MSIGYSTILRSIWRRKKRIFTAAGGLVAVIVGMLFLTSKMSDAYSTATRTAMGDPAIAQEYGPQKYAVLIGAGFKLGPEWSCANLLFLVIGDSDHGIVEITLRRRKIYRDSWRVLGVTKGYYTQSEVRCGAVE